MKEASRTVDETHDNEQQPIDETPASDETQEILDIPVTEPESLADVNVSPDDPVAESDVPQPDITSAYEINSEAGTVGMEEHETPPQKLFPWELMGGEDSSTQELAVSMDTEQQPAATTSSSRALVTIIASLGILIILVGAFSLKLWSDRLRAQQALKSAVSVVSGNAGLDPVGIRSLNDAVDKGNFGEVAGQIEKLARTSPVTSETQENAAPGLPSPFPGMTSPNTGPKGGPASRMQGRPGGSGMQSSAAGNAVQNQIPPEVMKFFEIHKDLAQAFGQANMAAVQLKERGGNVSKLRKLREEIFSAARLDDTKRVKQLLEDFRVEFMKQARKLGGGARPGMAGPGMVRPGQRMPRNAGRAPQMPPKSLMLAGQQAEQAIQQAQMQGKDVKKAMELMQQAGLAGRGGNFTLAQKLAGQAKAAAQSAQKQPAQPKLFDNPLVSMFLSLVQTENRELSVIMGNLKKAWDGRKTASIDTLANTTKQAADSLAVVGARRGKFSEELNRISGGGQAPQPPDRKVIEEQMRKRAEETKKELGELLLKMRTLTPEEFEAQRDKLIEDILTLVFKPQTPVKPVVDTGKPPILPVTPAAKLTREKVQEKLLKAAGPYLELRKDGKDIEQAEKLASIFTEARKALAAGKFEDADKLADEGLKLLGLDEKTPDDASKAPAVTPSAEVKTP